ncbi:MAG: 4Fe-4S dicluster domain-containing protein [Deltaproteobacteria bacterium]|jgi:ferredoxin|nr:4Fe-4S dicluster domain-containing protein [Deltaproteobacteria bacterium]
MSALRYLSNNGLNGLAARLAARARLLVPSREGASVVFREYAGGELCLARATVSPKAAVLPACETLFTFSGVKESAEQDAGKVAGKPALALSVSQEATPTVIFACRPCDARGIAVLDRPYLSGPYRDPYYAARRKELLVISLTCDAPCATCFCDWVGKGPADSEGSDVLMTQVGEGFAFEAVSQAGEALLRGDGLADVLAEGEAHREAVSAARKAGLDMRPPAPDLGGASGALGRRFADAGFWQDMTAHCLSCGACTYMCPTCYCFNISDEGDGIAGRRVRSWDSCMSSLFTREASGHNPRAAKALRMRNRVLHKFSYYPAVWNGAFSCSGCGRCIVNCPVQLDIRRIVLAGMAE